ncbi:hypothetical protein [Nostoc sp.]
MDTLIAGLGERRRICIISGELGIKSYELGVMSRDAINRVSTGVMS